MNLINRDIISVSEARKILGSKYSKVSDEQITHLIKSLDGIARAFIELVPKDKTN